MSSYADISFGSTSSAKIRVKGDFFDPYSECVSTNITSTPSRS